jgi:branched-chain amino acid transport system substrate-binding protein
MLAVEATRKAQEIHGVAEITPAMMRDGMEALNIDAARLAEMGMTGFGPEVSITCANHRGPGVGLMTQWDADAGTFVAISDFIEPDHEVIQALVAEDAAAFRAESGTEVRDCPAS